MDVFEPFWGRNPKLGAGPETSDPPPSPPTPVIAVFEGGGARGFAHLGAYRAVCELDFSIQYVAGTSAGALIACLIAAGFTPKELLDPENPGNHVLRRYGGKVPVDLFGGKEKFSQFRSLKNRLACHLKRLGDRMGDGSIKNPNFPGLRQPVAWLIFNIGLIDIWFRTKRARKLGGLFSTDTVRDELHNVLYRKIFGTTVAPAYRSGDVVRFRDLPIPLRVVAADITDEKHIVFGGRDTEDIPVADAVAASICIPLFFAAKELRGKRFLDGGMVSNLPTWVFDEARLGNPHLPTFAFSLKPHVKRGDGAFDTLMAVIETALFGGKEVGMRAIDRLVPVQIPAKLTTYDFDIDQERAVQIERDAFIEATLQLFSSLVDVPEVFRDVCHRICVSAQDELPKDQKVRVSIAIRPPDLRDFLRVTYSFNMEGDADDNLFLPIDRTLAGCAFTTRRILGPTAFDDLGMEGGQDKYRHALVWRDLVSCICIPIFKDQSVWQSAAETRPEPVGVLNIDSDGDLDPLADEEMLVKFSTLASEPFL
jgi:NTE family protein